MDDRPGMRMVWRNPNPVYEMVVIDDQIVIARKEVMVGLDADNGRERWERSYERQPHHLTRCGHGVAFALASRRAATQIAVLDLDGRDAWRYDRNWGLHFQGIVGDAQGLVLNGQDYGPVADDHWVGLDGATGSVVFDIKPLTDTSLTIAGRWLLADIDEAATRRGVTRSAFLAAAARKLIKEGA